MATVYPREEIVRVIEPRAVIAAMERAFVAYSNGEAVVPPVGSLDFDDPPGDCHIKYGYLKGAATFTVKIATGFWKNPERGLPSSNGVVLVFSAQTGELLTIFQDEGFLTDMRTAAAGAVAAKYLAPRDVQRIGILGTGLQARLQLEYLREVTSCRKVLLWGRSPARARDFRVEGFDIERAGSPAAVAADTNLIVTTTAAHGGLLEAGDVRPGTHITAMGADGSGKQELDPRLFQVAAVRAVDSLSQCSAFGDASFALAAGLIQPRDLIELGRIIQEPALRRRSDSDITLADLTGVAVQDMAIAELALEGLRRPAVASRRGP